MEWWVFPMGRGCVTQEEPQWSRLSFLYVPVQPHHVSRTPVMLRPTAGLR